MNKKPHQDQGTPTDKLHNVFPCRTQKRYFPAARNSSYAAIRITIHVRITPLLWRNCQRT